jgi:hypothetical protein
LWEPLAAALKGLDGTGRDVIIDAGRLGLVGSPEPLMYAADLMLLVMRSERGRGISIATSDLDDHRGRHRNETAICRTLGCGDGKWFM